jgi:hypothetical protein
MVERGRADGASADDDDTGMAWQSGHSGSPSSRLIFVNQSIGQQAEEFALLIEEADYTSAKHWRNTAPSCKLS